MDLQKYRRNGALLAALALSAATGCTSRTVLLANFNAESAGSPPAANQPTGTVSIFDGAGSVRVAPPPPGGSSNWAEIRHNVVNGAQTGLQGKFANAQGPGNYGLLASVFIPSDCGVVTLQFEPVQNGSSDFLSFFHLDFLTNNTVRIDDGPVTFGTFARNQFFTVSVNLNITSTTSIVTTTLIGTGASGSNEHNIQSPFLNLSRQIGGMRFWMGAQHVGAFKVDDIVVSFK